ncbi:uncharacterized protein LOC134669477 isoform X1 [Cydia fagiglandana]|uniref:uncharacterized protein LOC134669477 isoform X1 n=1 Tax=Cydia fagiglandana TaxID=1458189 RepID=UPI002FEDE90A
MGNKQLNIKKTSRKRQLGRFQQTMELTKRRKLDNFTAEHDTTSLDYIELQNMEMESPISSTTDIQSNDEATGSNILNPRIAQVDDTYRVTSLLEEEDTHELQILFNVEEELPDKTVGRRIVAVSYHSIRFLRFYPIKDCMETIYINAIFHLQFSCFVHTSRWTLCDLDVTVTYRFVRVVSRVKYDCRTLTIISDFYIPLMQWIPYRLLILKTYLID